MELVNAKIRWFDSLSGEGFVRLEDGSCVFVHFTAIECVDKHNYQWPKAEDRAFLSTLEGKSCKVKVYVDSHWKQVEKLIIAKD